MATHTGVGDARHAGGEEGGVNTPWYSPGVAWGGEHLDSSDVRTRAGHLTRSIYDMSQT